MLEGPERLLTTGANSAGGARKAVNKRATVLEVTGRLFTT